MEAAFTSGADRGWKGAKGSCGEWRWTAKYILKTKRRRWRGESGPETRYQRARRGQHGGKPENGAQRVCDDISRVRAARYSWLIGKATDDVEARDIATRRRWAPWGRWRGGQG